MKKILMLGSALCVLASYPASAGVAIVFNTPEPVYFYEPTRGYVIQPDYPSEHYDRHRHWHNDYWAHRQQEERDRFEHHDNGNHGEGNRGHEGHDHH